MFKKGNSLIINLWFVIILLFILFYILYIWADLIIPFIIALLFSFAIIWLSNFYRKIKIPSILSILLSIITYIAGFWLIGKLIWNNIDDLFVWLPSYEEKIIEIYSKFFYYFNIPEPTSFTELLKNINLQYVFAKLVWWFTSIFSNAGIILFYVTFILLEYRFFKNKLYLMIENNSQKMHILETVDKIKKDVKSYFVIKTIVSFFTWLISYFIMIALWLDFAVFWSLLIFILNFIPNIWSVIAVIFPSILSIVQPWFSFYDSILLISWLIWTQILMWNIVETKFMWNKLNLSPLVIIISLWFWWSLWGVVGMLLSVPIMVIINIILSKIPLTRPIAIFLSEKWELQIDDSEEISKNRKKLLKSFKDKIIKIKKKK